MPQPRARPSGQRPRAPPHPPQPSVAQPGLARPGAELSSLCAPVTMGCCPLPSLPARTALTPKMGTGWPAKTTRMRKRPPTSARAAATPAPCTAAWPPCPGPCSWAMKVSSLPACCCISCAALRQPVAALHVQPASRVQSACGSNGAAQVVLSLHLAMPAPCMLQHLNLTTGSMVPELICWWLQAAPHARAGAPAAPAAGRARTAAAGRLAAVPPAGLRSAAWPWWLLWTAPPLVALKTGR